MQISHAEARKLIQHSMDEPLFQEQESALAIHLQACSECSRYRDEIRDTEDLLRSTMKKHWNLAPAAIGMDVITGKVRYNSLGKLGAQLVMVSLMIMLVSFGAWRLVNINIISTKVTPPQISPIPTPSTQMTGTRTLAPNCKEIVYTIQKGDTLAGIASMFSTSAEIIATRNHLQPDALKVGSKIIVPICFTQSANTRPATFTVTFSPAPLTALSP